MPVFKSLSFVTFVQKLCISLKSMKGFFVHTNNWNIIPKTLCSGNMIEEQAANGESNKNLGSGNENKGKSVVLIREKELGKTEKGTKV